MKSTLWWRRLSISAPTMIIKSKRPWPFKALVGIVIIGIAGSFLIWAYDLGRNIKGFGPNYKERAHLLEEKLDKLRNDSESLSMFANSADSALKIERATQQQLANQIKSLEAENNRLKEDLAFFESLLPANTGGNGINIRRIKAELISPTQLQYRLLLLQGGKTRANFVGDLQLTVTAITGGKSTMLVFPSTPAEASKFKLDFKYYQRIEGMVTLPNAATVKTLSVRVLEKSQIRAQQSINL